MGSPRHVWGPHPPCRLGPSLVPGGQTGPRRCQGRAAGRGPRVRGGRTLDTVGVSGSVIGCDGPTVGGSPAGRLPSSAGGLPSQRSEGIARHGVGRNGRPVGWHGVAGVPAGSGAGWYAHVCGAVPRCRYRAASCCMMLAHDPCLPEHCGLRAMPGHGGQEPVRGTRRRKLHCGPHRGHTGARTVNRRRHDGGVLDPRHVFGSAGIVPGSGAWAARRSGMRWLAGWRGCGQMVPTAGICS